MDYKVGSLRKNTTFLNAIGGDQGLSDILKANKRARCSSCGSSGATHMKLMPDYLDDVEYFALTFGSTQGNGFDLVLSELKRMNANGSANYAMEGAAYMIDYVKKTPQINKNSVSKFDGKFDFDPDNMDLCTDCRFDIALTPDYGGIKYEFKSWGSTAINKIGTPSGASFTNQFKAYLADATDISKIQYIFDANKFSDVNALKSRFKLMFESDPQGMFEVMKPELRSKLLGMGNENNFLLFSQKVSDINSNLYSFILSK